MKSNKNQDPELDYFFLDPSDPQSRKDYETFNFGSEEWAIPYSDLRLTKFLGYPRARYPHFTGGIIDDEETGTRWTYGGYWHNQFPKDGNPENRLPGLIYKVNSDDFHGEEFHFNPDILALGCSVTSGLGLPHNFSWPYVLGHVLGKTVNNLGTPGQSPAFMAYLAMQHIAKFGKPKSIFFMVPPLDRYWGPTADFDKKSSLRDREWRPSTVSYNNYNKCFEDRGGSPFFYTSLDGHKSILPIDIVAHINLAMVEMIAMFCVANNIELRLASWEKQTYCALRLIDYPEVVKPPMFLKKPRSKNKSFVHSPNENCYNNWGYPIEIMPIGSRKNCPCGKTPQSFWQEEMWDYALDINHKRFNPHPGLHMQIHLAEFISGMEINSNMYGDLKAWHEGTKFEPEDLDEVTRPDRKK